jgi:hypothetical protein
MPPSVPITLSQGVEVSSQERVAALRQIDADTGVPPAPHDAVPGSIGQEGEGGL